jgi:hypothetical protein
MTRTWAATTDTPGEDVIGDMQVILDRWGGVLRATGGALVPKKSYWYAIDFRGLARNGYTVTRQTCLEIS